jgi:hypothetical protein
MCIFGNVNESGAGYTDEHRTLNVQLAIGEQALVRLRRIERRIKGQLKREHGMRKEARRQNSGAMKSTGAEKVFDITVLRYYLLTKPNDRQ